MKKMTYSKDVDVFLIELSNEPIAQAEDQGNTILHYTEDSRLVLIEILDFRRSISEKTIKELSASQRSRSGSIAANNCDRMINFEF